MLDARKVTRALKGRWHGSYGSALCPAHDNTRTPALSVSNGRDGRLLAKCHAGCRYHDIVDALELIGVSDDILREPDAAEMARREAAEAQDAAHRISRAKRLWDSSKPLAETLAARYLEQRAIKDCSAESLRFCPAASHPASARDHPALVARVDRDGTFVGVHRTFLAEPGAKANVTPVKAMLGRVKGGAVLLTPPAPRIAVAEGIESALSLSDGLTGHEDVAVVAALSVSGVANFVWPEGTVEIIAAPDNDPSGRNAAAKLAERCEAAGVRCSLILPTLDGADWNDLAQAEAA